MAFDKISPQNCWVEADNPTRNYEGFQATENQLELVVEPTPLKKYVKVKLDHFPK